MGSQAHRATLKKGHKAFKSKHASKGELKARNKGKIEKNDHKSKSGHVTSKADRRNTARQIKDVKAAKSIENKKFFIGSSGVPKIVAVLSLCDDSDPIAVVSQLNDCLDIKVQVPDHGSILVNIDRFKQKLHYLIPRKSLDEYISASQVADYVILILSSTQDVSSFGEQSLRCISNMGVSNIIPICSNIDSYNSTKTQDEVRQSLSAWIKHFFADADKLYCPQNRSEALNMIRSVCEKSPKGVQWRDQRPYMLPDRIEQSGSGITAVSGYLRGMPLSVDSLVYLNQGGAFQLDQITDGVSVIKPSDNQVEIDELSPESSMTVDDANESEPDELGIKMIGFDYHEDPGLHTAKHERAPKRATKVPEGTSDYQAAWLIESESEDENGTTELADENGTVELADADNQHDIDMDVDSDDESQDNESIFDSRQADSDTDDELNFDQKTYDEIKLHPDFDAKQQLAGFRGVRDLRTCEWNADEHDKERPEIWNRLLRIHNHKATSNQILKQDRFNPISPGKYVTLFIRTGQAVVDSSRLLTVFGLLPYENKLTTLHTTIRIDSEADTEAFISGEPLTAVIGPRVYKVYPRFSMLGRSSNNVYREEKLLVKGQVLTASILAPFAVGNVPVLYLKETANDDGLIAMATGIVQDSAPDRIIAERVLVTGQIFKMHRRKVTIRRMFYSPEAVRWFKMVPLFTDHGRVGYIKEPLGTHGYFKATFDGKLNSQDDVKMALYRRAWPICADEITRLNKGTDRYLRRITVNWR